MIATDVPERLTRVVIDHDCGIEVVQMQSVAERIQEMLPHVSAADRDYITNALLTFALRAFATRSA
jgi:hypothetical protein